MKRVPTVGERVASIVPNRVTRLSSTSPDMMATKATISQTVTARMTTRICDRNDIKVNPGV